MAAMAVTGWCASAPVAHAEPEPTPAPAPKTTIDTDGTYVVGTDIAPGTYTSAGPLGDGACYWKRMAGDQIVHNALTKKPQVVLIDPADTAFTTNECQPWQKTDGPPPAQPAPGDLLGRLRDFIGSGILSGR
jgi:hypothetical protein